MDTNWAAEHLQTIRTLMERSAVYRRALAPIMVWSGIVGAAGGILGWKLEINTVRGFVDFWSGVAFVAIIGSFLLVRRQALKDSEPFWSPPTRRIAQALLPPFFIGGFLNTVVRFTVPGEEPEGVFIMVVWLWLYGCAAHAAGFSMPRGMKLFGWLYIILGCAMIGCGVWNEDWIESVSPHLLMGATFGGLHLAYGVYLYLTEKGKNAA
jgi:hypothetical protein